MIVQGQKVIHNRRKQLWDYWQRLNGEWWGLTPAGVANLSAHEITEHDDGTISCKPSILVMSTTTWHGYLERGVWRGVV